MPICRQRRSSRTFFPWHWHTAFEIDYIEGCNVQFNFVGKSLCVPQGSAIFINSEEIHSYCPENPTSCKIYALLFDPVFLAGSYNDTIYMKYVAPVISADLTAFKISSEAEPYQILISQIKNMLHLFLDEPPYYELALRSELGIFWGGLIDKLKATHEFSCPKNRDRARMKKMLDYIHSNYSSQLSLTDVAESAMIGTRECSRCFHRSIGRPPMDYLNDYRIQMAIHQLVSTNKNITEISEACGFSSISYFGKVFKKCIGLSPLQYRFSL